MSQDGYTLAEAMAALVMIGLAIGGLGQAAYLIGRLNTAAGVEVTYADASGSQTISVDKLIVCVGRRPFTGNLLGEGTGVTFSRPLLAS